MEMSSLDKLMEPLQGPDLAQAHLDLPSWLLGDEAHLGFCQGAKEMHSLPAGVAGHASPPFITSDISDLDIYDQIDWDKPLLLENYFPQDLKEQVKNLSAAEFAANAPSLKPENVERWATPVPADVASEYEAVGEQPSPEVLLHWSGGIPAFVTPKESELDNYGINAAPQVISVPISDAVSKQTAVIKSDYSPPSESAPSMVIVKRIPTTAFSQVSEPQKIVINLKRVSVFPKSPAPVPSSSPLPETSAAAQTHPYDVHTAVTEPRSLTPTLKDVFSRDDAEEQLLDLLKPEEFEEPESPSISIAEDHQFYSMDSVECDSVHESVSLMSPSAESIGAEMTYEELTEDSGVFLLSPESYCSEQMSPPHVTSFKAVKSSGRKPRPSPYSPMEKKLRKKEQNKRAALRYRQKKKEEEEGILSLLQKEESRQKDLKEKYDSLQMEVRLLKNLMREVVARKKQNR